MEKKTNPQNDKPTGFTVQDRRFWARKESDVVKEGERPPRKSDYPTVVEQLQGQMEASREKLKKRLEELDQEKSAFRQRIAAEMDRRLEKEKLKIIEILLEVLDNLEAAIEGAVASAEEESPLFLGVTIIRDDLWSKLHKLNVNRIDSIGKPFDPELHEAVMTKPVGPEGDGVVLEEIQAGYQVNDMLIRPAKVVVGSAE